MRKTFYQRNKAGFDTINGLFLGNTVLERGLVLSPVIVASYSYENSLILGMGFLIITFFTVLLSSFVPKSIPYTLRTITYTIIASLIFIPTAILVDVLFPNSLHRLGVFFPLLVVNSLIVIKSESRFHKRSKAAMMFDLFCHTAGFFIVIVLVGSAREILGTGAFMGNPIDMPFSVQAILLPFSGFIIVGFLAALMKRIKYRLENPHIKSEN